MNGQNFSSPFEKIKTALVETDYIIFYITAVETIGSSLSWRFDFSRLTHLKNPNFNFKQKSAY